MLPLALAAASASITRASITRASINRASINRASITRPSRANDACNPKDLPSGTHTTQILGPSKVDKASVWAWFEKMKAMRAACQKQIKFNGSAFELPALKWTQTSYYQPQMHPYDRYFFDPSLGNGTNGSGYTVQRWLDDLNKRFGGIDSALLWPVYTNLGIDDRNQFDMIRTLPGGVEGLKAVVQQLHDANVKVLWAYNKWDFSTKGQQQANTLLNSSSVFGGTDPMNLARVLRDTGADGFNGDTMGHIPQAYQDAAMKIYKPVAMEAEGGLGRLTDMNYDTIGWAEGWQASEPSAVNNIPDVNKPKWVSNGKAMSNWSDRYSGSPESADEYGGTSKIPALQVAWFNGVGFETWENIWGVWNRILDRDAEALRRVGVLLRYFGQRGFLTSPGWVPHSTEVLTMARGVFGSAFPSADGEEVVYTLVNRVPTPLLAAHLQPSKAQGSSASSYRYYDCYNGRELAPHPENGSLSFKILGYDFGCVVATRNHTAAGALAELSEQEEEALWSALNSSAPSPPPTLTALLRTMRALTKQPLSSYDADWRDNCLRQEVVSPTGKTSPLRPLRNASATEVYVPGAVFNFQASCVQIEGGAGSGVGVQWPWEPLPQRHHNRTLHMGAMYVDKHPVTNAEYASYLKASGYHPADSAHWLEQNFERTSGAPTEPIRKPKRGWERKPVTYVSLRDAKEYCAYHGKRLPHAYEWQYFAQSTDGRRYPWGDDYDPARVPRISNNFTNPGPEPVGAHASGASPFGVEDLVGSVWQYTTEFQDEHTRSVVLRGGSNYAPWRGGVRTEVDPAPGCFDPSTGRNLSHPYGGSRWYFRPAIRLDNYNKYFVMSGSYERAGTVGFRCVADAEDDCGTGGDVCIGSVSLDNDRTGDAETWPISSSPNNNNMTWRGLRVLTDQTLAMSITAPPPPPGRTKASLRLRLSSKLGAHGNLTASVVGDQGTGTADSDSTTALLSLRVTPDITALIIVYRGGPLRLRYATATAAAVTTTTARGWASPSACTDDSHLCLLSAGEVCAYGLPMVKCVTNLSRTGVSDWAHWGSLYSQNSTAAHDAGKWFANRKKRDDHTDGLSPLQPTLELPDGAKATDLSTWEGQFWPSDRAVYSWSGGTPIARAGDAEWWAARATPTPRAGVTSAIGKFAMNMSAPAAGGRQKLTLYLGLGNFGAAFGNSAVLELQSRGDGGELVTSRKVVEHDYGANNNWRNTKFEIVFDRDFTVTWSLGPCNPDNPNCGLLSWQAATLEEYHDGTGRVSIESAEVDQQAEHP